MPRDLAAVINRFEDVVDRRTAKSVVDADPYAAISYNATPVAIRRFEDKSGTVPTPTVSVVMKRNTRSLVRPASVVVPELPAPSKTRHTAVVEEPQSFSWADSAVVTTTTQRRETLGTTHTRGVYEPQPSKMGQVPRSRREKRERKAAKSMLKLAKSRLLERVRDIHTGVWDPVFRGGEEKQMLLYAIDNAHSATMLRHVEVKISSLEWKSGLIRLGRQTA